MQIIRPPRLRGLLLFIPTLGTAWGWGTGAVAAAALAESLDKPFPWAVGFFFGNPELSLELWNVIAGVSRLDD